MRNKNKTAWLKILAVAAFCCQTSICAAWLNKRIDIAFGNQSTNEIWVDAVYYNGKRMAWPAGALVPNATKTTVGVILPDEPKDLRIEFSRNGEKSKTQVDVTRLGSDLQAKTKGSDDVTLHLAFSAQKQGFIANVGSRPRGATKPYEQSSPYENEPGFNDYRALAKAAYEGNVEEMRKAIRDGARVFWPDEPSMLSPLESAALSTPPQLRLASAGCPECVPELLKMVGSDFPQPRYANATKLAAQGPNMKVLEALLEHPNAAAINEKDLRNIAAAACGQFVTGPEGLERLMKRFKFGVDFRVTDTGHTLLHWAVMNRNFPVAEWLVKNGANCDATLNGGGYKPIQFARTEELKKLLQPPQPAGEK